MPDGWERNLHEVAARPRADVNFRNYDDEGETQALMVAAKFGWIVNVFSVLLERGADPFLKGGNFTALDAAREVRCIARDGLKKQSTSSPTR